MPDGDREPGTGHRATAQAPGISDGDQRIQVVVEVAPAGAVPPGPAALRVLSDTVEIATPAGAALAIPLGAIDGVSYTSPRLTLAVRGRAAVVVTGPPRLAGVAREVVAAACVFPEVTRALRGFGSRRWREAGAHDALVAPLLAARRRAARTAEVAAQVAAFDAETLRDALVEAIAALAGGRGGRSAADRRALGAHLEELALPLHGALRRLGEAADRWRREEELARIARWREWLAAVAQLLAEADRFGFDAASVARDWREDVPPSWWRRAMRRDA